jgi:methylthioribulose-1-phosphate dehydratase
MTLSNPDPRPTLIETASYFYKQGWMLGTAGNLSARLADGNFWITASGKPKGDLTLNDFVQMQFDSVTGTASPAPEQPDPQNRPSAETTIHTAIYTLFPEAQACYHVHSIEANLISQASGPDIPLPPLEMIKGLGIWTENPQVTLPLFENYQDVPQIAQVIVDRFRLAPPQIPVLLIRSHGVTVWANTPQQALHHLEIAEYLFRYMVMARQINL